MTLEPFMNEGNKALGGGGCRGSQSRSVASNCAWSEWPLRPRGLARGLHQGSGFSMEGGRQCSQPY